MNMPGFWVYVFSLPREGSSIYTRVVRELGVNIVQTTDDRQQKEQRDASYRNVFGEYVPNEQFCEIQPATLLDSFDKIRATPYSGCKMIIPQCLGGIQWQLVTSAPAKVIMLWRDEEEIRQSQEAFYAKTRTPQHEVEDPDEEAELKRADIRSYLADCKLKLMKQRDRSNEARFRKTGVQPFDFMVTTLDDLTERTQKTVIQIARFIQAPRRIWNAVEEVNPALVRFKRGELTENI